MTYKLVKVMLDYGNWFLFGTTPEDAQATVRAWVNGNIKADKVMFTCQATGELFAVASKSIICMHTAEPTPPSAMAQGPQGPQYPNPMIPPESGGGKKWNGGIN